MLCFESLSLSLRMIKAMKIDEEYPGETEGANNLYHLHWHCLWETLHSQSLRLSLRMIRAMRSGEEHPSKMQRKRVEKIAIEN